MNINNPSGDEMKLPSLGETLSLSRACTGFSGRNRSVLLGSTFRRILNKFPRRKGPVDDEAIKFPSSRENEDSIKFANDEPRVSSSWKEIYAWDLDQAGSLVSKVFKAEATTLCNRPCYTRVIASVLPLRYFRKWGDLWSLLSRRNDLHSTMHLRIFSSLWINTVTYF